MRAATFIILCSPCLLLAPSDASAQEAKGEEVVFFTSDHVEIAGTFFPGGKGRLSPCVLLLHTLGGSRETATWEPLEKRLRKEGYAVLAFDFRGHGRSTTVAPEYWQSPLARSLKPSGSTNTIHSDQFLRASHYAALVNDIRAARRVLEFKGSRGECDASQIYVIGVDTAAPLGLLWIDAEWQRWRVAKDAGGRPMKVGAEALDIAGAVWLSLNAHWPGRYTAPVENWLAASTCERIPMGFLYYEEDTRAKSQSLTVFEKLSKSAKDVHRLTATLGVDDSMRVSEMIGTYFGNIAQDRRRPVRTPPDLETLPPVFHPEAYGIR